MLMDYPHNVTVKIDGICTGTTYLRKTG
jgi:hypothetical protein